MGPRAAARAEQKSNPMQTCSARIRYRRRSATCFGGATARICYFQRSRSKRLRGLAIRLKIDRARAARQNFEIRICGRSVWPVDCWSLHRLQAHRIRLKDILLDGVELLHPRRTICDLTDAEFGRATQTEGPCHSRIGNEEVPRDCFLGHELEAAVRLACIVKGYELVVSIAPR